MNLAAYHSFVLYCSVYIAIVAYLLIRELRLFVLFGMGRRDSLGRLVCSCGVIENAI